jgi:hypothetical protein
MEEKFWGCIYPSLTVLRDSPCRDQAMQMNMIPELLIPCMEYGNDTYIPAQPVPGVFSKFKEFQGDCAKRSA